MRLSFVKYFSYILLFFGFFLFPFITYAAISNNPAAETQIWMQLQSEIINSNGRILAKLSGGLIHKPDSPIYIVECLDTVDDRVCSTGTEEGDKVIYQSNENLQKMQALYQYVFKGLYWSDGKSVKNPLQPTGDVSNLFWESVIKGDVNRKFYGISFAHNETDLKALPQLEKIHTGYSGGQQQAAFEIKVPTPLSTKRIEIQSAPSPVSSGHTRCSDEPNPTPVTYNNFLPHSWLSTLLNLLGKKVEAIDGAGADENLTGCDPYGRVFDAVSLEPIPNAKVSLLTQRQNGDFSFMSPKETINAIINPWTTREDGKFVYLVPSGTYQLSVDLPNYSFPFSPIQLNPNYMKAYYELYYAPGFTDKNIVEKGTIEHRDIPIVPKGEPYRAPVKLLGYMSELYKKKEQYLVTGRVSHPLTIIEIFGKKIDTSEVTRTLSKVTADKWGFFSATINTSILKPDEVVGMAKMNKVDLTQNGPSALSQKQSFSSFLLSLFNIFPRSSSFAEKEKPKTPEFTLARINPLLNYLEGYAYDSNNQPISNAKVTIYLSGSKKPYYVTKADEKGYFIITSQHLPQMNYSISYAASNGKTYLITQTTFLEQNVKTFLTKNINVNKYITSLASFNVSAQERMRFSENIKNTIPSSVDNKKISISEKNNSTVLIFFVIFLFLLASAIGIVFYLRKIW